MSSRLLPFTVLFLFFSVGFPAGVADNRPTGQPPPPPENLPTPPPLPPELKEKTPTAPPPELPDPSELKRQLKQLEELLSMSPERLQRLRQTIAFIEKMASGEREAMRIRIRQITETSPALEKEIDRLGQWLPASLQSDLSQFWLAATPDQRQSVRDRLARIKDEQKPPFLKEKVRSFIERRDRVFQEMQESIEEKQRQGETP